VKQMDGAANGARARRALPDARRSATIGLAIGLPVSAVFLWLAVRKTEPSAVWAALTDASIGRLAVAVCVMGVVYVLQSERWRRIAGVAALSRRWYVETVVSGVAVNNVLPGRLGDIMRARWLSVDGKVAGGRAFATVIVDRAFDVAALVVLLFAGLTVAADTAWLWRIVIGGSVLLVAIGAVITFARIYTARRPRARRGERGIARRLVRDTLEGLAEPLSAAKSVRLGVLSLCAWGAWAVSAWFVASAVDVRLSLLEVAFVAAVINLGVAIPSSPGFVGTYQWLAVSALAVFAVGREDALAFAILLQAVWYVPTTLVGGALVIRRAFTRRSTTAVRASRSASPV
jgi:glycosyltransferase 2 family protein